MSARAGRRRAALVSAAAAVVVGVVATAAALVPRDSPDPVPRLQHYDPEPAPGAAVSAARLSPPPTPPAATDDARTAREVGAKALRTLGFDWRSTGFEVVFLPGRDGLLGETLRYRKLIKVYVRPHHDASSVARVLAHELGHAVDLTHGRPALRRQWLAARGAEGTPWWPGEGTSDYDSGAGDFAEVFTRWLLSNSDFRSTVAPPPSAAQLQALAARFFPVRARTDRVG